MWYIYIMHNEIETLLRTTYLAPTSERGPLIRVYDIGTGVCETVPCGWVNDEESHKKAVETLGRDIVDILPTYSKERFVIQCK